MKSGLEKGRQFFFGALAVALVSGCGGTGEAGAPPQATDEGSAVADGVENCSPNGAFTTVTSGTLTVSVSNQLPYFEEQSGELKGIEGAIVEQFAVDNCLDVEVLAPGESGTVAAVQSGRSDLAASGSYVTPERKKVVDFSAPTWQDRAVFVSKDGVSTVEAARDLVVATVQGYGWEEQLEDVVGEVKFYEGAEGLYSDLGSGRIDVSMDASTTAPWYLQLAGIEDNFQVVPIEPHSGLDASRGANNYAFPYTKGNDELGEALNTTIERMRAEGRIAELLAEFGIDPQNAEVQE